MQKTKPSKLLDANTAVESYLDNLLQEATERPPQRQAKPVKEKPVDNVHRLETALTVEKITVTKKPKPVRVKKAEAALEPAKPAPQETLQEALNFPIQCLMFKVEGHLLAIPLIQMGSVVPFADKLTQLPHSPSHFKGLLKHRERNIKVVDTAVLLLKKTIKETFNPSHILVFENEKWAISADEIMDVVTLNEEDIKPHENSKNRLSLGTIKTSLALILSPNAIVKRLEGNDCRMW